MQGISCSKLARMITNQVGVLYVGYACIGFSKLHSYSVWPTWIDNPDDEINFIYFTFISCWYDGLESKFSCGMWTMVMSVTKGHFAAPKWLPDDFWTIYFTFLTIFDLRCSKHVWQNLKIENVVQNIVHMINFMTSAFRNIQNYYQTPLELRDRDCRKIIFFWYPKKKYPRRTWPRPLKYPDRDLHKVSGISWWFVLDRLLSRSNIFDPDFSCDQIRRFQ